MKKYKIICLLVFFIFIAMNVVSAEPTTHHVASTNNHTEIQNTINNMNDGDILFFDDGDYSLGGDPYSWEGYRINKTINITCNSGKVNIVSKNIDISIFTISSNNVNISNFNLISSAQTSSHVGTISVNNANNVKITNIEIQYLYNYNYNVGIFINNSDIVLIDNVIIHNMTAEGIWVHQSNNCAIINSKIYNCGERYYSSQSSADRKSCIRVDDGTNFKIINSTIDNATGNGIYLDTEYGTIENCNISNTLLYCVYLKNYCKINKSNIKLSKDVGIYISGINNSILDTTLFNCSNQGIWIQNSANYNLINNCSIYNTNIGIFINGGSYNTINNSNISKNIDGIKIITGLYSPRNNIIEYCKIYNNTNGVNLTRTSYNQFINCEVFDNENGIIINGTNNNITNGLIYDNKNGIIINSSNTNIDDGSVYDNENGIIINFRSNVLNNLSINNNENGIIINNILNKINNLKVFENDIGIISNGTSNTFTNNSINENLIGINFIKGSNTFVNGTVTNNQVGILLNSTKNTIKSCQILTNEIAIIIEDKGNIINYNRIYNNTIALENKTDNIDANLNWWGSNIPPIDLSLDNWFVLELIANKFITIVSDSLNYSNNSEVNLTYSFELNDNITSFNIDLLPNFSIAIIDPNENIHNMNIHKLEPLSYSFKADELSHTIRGLSDDENLVLSINFAKNSNIDNNGKNNTNTNETNNTTNPNNTTDHNNNINTNKNSTENPKKNLKGSKNPHTSSKTEKSRNTTKTNVKASMSKTGFPLWIILILIYSVCIIFRKKNN